MKKAFTLAEVLITLMIIGIVAALTIPSVISNYQQQEFKTGLKKAVSVLNEAIQMNISQDGETPYDRAHPEEEEIGGLSTFLSRHMNIIKVIRGGYQSSIRDNNGNSRVQFYNTAFYTTDGMRFETFRGQTDLQNSNIKLHESNYQYAGSIETNRCGSYGLANNPNNTSVPPCLMLVDVNGDKKPTVYGANVALTEDGGSIKQNYIFPAPSDKKINDIFLILITEDRAIPFGVVAQRAMYSK